MSQTITLSLPDDVHQTLLKWAGEAGWTPEAYASAWLASSVRAVAQDPLIQLAGTIESDVTDLAERHDYYIGQALLEEMRGDHDG